MEELLSKFPCIGTIKEVNDQGIDTACLDKAMDQFTIDNFDIIAEVFLNRYPGMEFCRVSDQPGLWFKNDPNIILGWNFARATWTAIIESYKFLLNNPKRKIV